MSELTPLQQQPDRTSEGHLAKDLSGGRDNDSDCEQDGGHLVIVEGGEKEENPRENAFEGVEAVNCGDGSRIELRPAEASLRSKMADRVEKVVAETSPGERILTLDLTAVADVDAVVGTDYEDDELSILDEDQQQQQQERLVEDVLRQALADHPPSDDDEQHQHEQILAGIEEALSRRRSGGGKSTRPVMITSANGDHCYVSPTKELPLHSAASSSPGMSVPPRQSLSQSSDGDIVSDGDFSSAYQGLYVSCRKTGQQPMISRGMKWNRPPKGPPKFTFRIFIGASRPQKAVAPLAPELEVMEPQESPKPAMAYHRRKQEQLDPDREYAVHRRRHPPAEKRYRYQYPYGYISNMNSGEEVEAESGSGRERDVHNFMERRRRVELRDGFALLQQLVPGFSGGVHGRKVPYRHIG
jgi:hypothetical protein